MNQSKSYQAGHTSKKSGMTFSGFMQGALSWLLWMPLTIGILVGFAYLLGDGAEGLGAIFIIIMIIVPIILSLWTGRLISDFQNHELNEIQRARFIKTRKTLITFFVSFILILMLFGESYLDNSDAWMVFIGTPALITLFIVFISPVMYKGILGILGSQRSNSSNGRTVTNRRQHQQVQSGGRQGSWFKDRIVAPVLVGIILGIVAYLITGQFDTGGGVSLITTTITLVLR